MQATRWFIVPSFLCLALSASAWAERPDALESPAARAIDQLLSENAKPDEPGAAVIAVRDGETVVLNISDRHEPTCQYLVEESR